ncbi:MAG TPA: MFS transporter [Candidatus Limnocylindrales bacterium]|nr:MFS transporter [Candidatus Limnocylindrales bacterium]
MSTPGTPLSFRDVLQLKPIRRLWIAQMVSVFGDFLAVFAIIALVTFKLHGTATQVGLVLVAFMAPFAVVSPIAGVFVDRWNLKSTLIASDLIRGVMVLSLLLVNDIYVMYAVLFVMSVVSSFFVPAQSVAVRTLAPMNGLLAVNGLMSQAQQGSMILAPSVAGELVQVVGANSCFVFDSLSFFFSAALVMTLTIERPAAAPAAARAGGGLAAVRHSMAQGFRFIFTHPTLSFVIVSMTSGMFAMRCFGALLSVYVRDILNSTSAAFGVLNTVIGVGMIISTQFLTRIGRKVPPQNLVVYGLGGMGIAVLVTAVFGAMGSTAAGMLMMGGSAAAIFIPAQTLLQHETPQEMLGRVMSSLMSLVAGAQVAAMLVAAPVAQFAGIRTLYFASAAMLLLISLIGYWKVPETAAAVQAAR